MFAYFIYIVAGMGAGIGTGLAGLSAAAVISPMLITYLGFDPYAAVEMCIRDRLRSAVENNPVQEGWGNKLVLIRFAE